MGRRIENRALSGAPDLTVQHSVGSNLMAVSLNTLAREPKGGPEPGLMTSPDDQGNSADSLKDGACRKVTK